MVAAVLRGHREEYALLVRRYQERLFRFALGMVADPDTAADLVQDSFIKAYTDLDSCKDPGRVGAWLFSIVRNRCRDHLKSPRTHAVARDALPALVSMEAGPEEQTASGELRASVQAALASLPEPQREAFLLKHLEGHSYEEMANQLGTSVSALKMRVLRAREALQSLLGDSLT